MTTPLVSFVVPCFKLGHLLPECVNSILSQTCSDLEVIIMDDCSPDNTSEVAQGLRDARIKYVRNERNLGLVDNFNKGIALSRGKYVWIISADDYLGKPYTLERYVRFLEAHPTVGYVFSPPIKVNAGGRQVGGRSLYSADRVIDGREFLKGLVKGNLVEAPTAMARRECYEKMGSFPTAPVWAGEKLDFRWAQDWYLWCLFALVFDVGYLAEPMVCYREHDLSITSTLTQEQTVRLCAAADVAVPWLIKQRTDQYGLRKASRYCLHGIVAAYDSQLRSKQYRSSTLTMTLDQFEDSLCRSTSIEAERDWIRSRTYVAMADELFWRGDADAARNLYAEALRRDWRVVGGFAKFFLVSLGPAGIRLRRFLTAIRANIIMPIQRRIN